jgi:phosphoserine phosphatase RsbU/P
VESGVLPRNFAIVSIAGPPGAESVTLPLAPPGPVLIGRRQTHHLFLPDPASRDHAMLVFEPSTAQWLIIDTNSKHGTRLNGVPMVSGRKYPLRAQDLIEIRPWTFQLLDRDDRSQVGSTLHTFDDEASHDRIDRIGPSGSDLARDRLTLLLQCAKGINAAEDDAALAEAVLDAAVLGTGYANAALLRPLAGDTSGNVSVIGVRGSIVPDAREPRLSRSLIARASRGEPVRLSRGLSAAAAGASIVDLGIDEALCVPLMLGGAIAGFLYLDNRRADRYLAPVAADAAEFAVGLAQLAAMAITNFRRRDLEHRLAGIEAELKATAEAQRWILPARHHRYCTFTCHGESRPGHTVSGDFYDIVPLGEQRFAITLGDVVGKGVAASVLMTATQGFLHAALGETGDPGKAVRALNAYISPRCGEGHFVTLWIGVFDAVRNTLRYVDAGHGYGVLLRAAGGHALLREGGGPPIGIDPDSTHDAADVTLSRGDRVVVVSDGLVEQPGRHGNESVQFGLNGVLDVIAPCATAEQAIAALFDAVQRHAGGPALADDATAVLVALDDVA